MSPQRDSDAFDGMPLTPAARHSTFRVARQILVFATCRHTLIRSVTLPHEPPPSTRAVQISLERMADGAC
jgi:hypothetical protein